MQGSRIDMLCEALAKPEHTRVATFDLWVGSYLDDVLLIFVEHAGEMASPTADLAARPNLLELERLRTAHRKAGTVLHETKRVERASTGVFWGAEFQADAKVSGELESSDPLVLLTVALLDSLVSWRELSQVVSN